MHPLSKKSYYKIYARYILKLFKSQDIFLVFNQHRTSVFLFLRGILFKQILHSRYV